MASQIKIKRGSGLNSSYVTALNYNTNHDTLVSNSCEPWISTSSKQLWVDGTCINKKLVANDNSLIIGTAGVNSVDNITVEIPISVKLSNAEGNILSVDQYGLYATSPAAPESLGYGKFFVQNYNESDNVGGLLTAIKSNEQIRLKSLNEWIVFDTTNSTSEDLDIIKIRHKNYIGAASPAGTYGDSTHVAQITVDSAGHVTSAESVAISMPTMPTATIFKGTIGDGTESPSPTITFSTLPIAGGTVEQYAYKFVSDCSGVSNCPSAKTGDFVVCVNLGDSVNPNYIWMVIPSGDDNGLQTITGSVSGDTPNNSAIWTLSDSGGTVSLIHTAQSSGVGSVVNFSASNNTITMDINVIDGGTF